MAAKKTVICPGCDKIWVVNLDKLYHFRCSRCGDYGRSGNALSNLIAKLEEFDEKHADSQNSS